MKFQDIQFCDHTKHTSLIVPNQACDSSQPSSEFESSFPRSPALSRVDGTIVDANVVYSSRDITCVDYYTMTLKTDNNEIVKLILSSHTYSVDCGVAEKGGRMICFYNSISNYLNLYPPAYDVLVVAFDKPNRKIAADFFDCYLLSQDKSIQLTITNNTYIIDFEGRPYCGALTNKYLILLYNEAEGIDPMNIEPNVVVVL